MYSTQNEDWGATGRTLVDPLHYFQEPPESEVATPDIFEHSPLVMITGRRSPVFFHAGHRNIPWLRELYSYPDVEIQHNVAHDFKKLNQ